MDMVFLFQTESIVLTMIMYHLLIHLMFPPAKIVPLKKVLVVEIANGPNYQKSCASTKQNVSFKISF